MDKGEIFGYVGTNGSGKTTTIRHMMGFIKPKGIKQKTAIAAALMADREILILDEPTTGLAPLMREAFVELIREEKKRGKTIFMSSHIFEEIEEGCDRVAMIRSGKIADTVNLHELRHWETKHFTLTFASEEDLQGFVTEWGGDKDKYKVKGDADAGKYSCSIKLPKNKTGRLLHVLSHYTLSALHEENLTLEQYFKQVYEKGEQ